MLDVAKNGSLRKNYNFCASFVRIAFHTDFTVAGALGDSLTDDFDSAEELTFPSCR